MNLYPFTVFRAVVETGSFSKAAMELHLAHSAVSDEVKALCRSDVSIIALAGIVKTRAVMTIDFALEAERKEDRAPEKAIFAALSPGPTLDSAPAICPWFGLLAQCFQSLPTKEGEGRIWFRRIVQ
jgi:Bacterial regulatory helix-turn-helix protein, lysR family